MVKRPKKKRETVNEMEDSDQLSRKLDELEEHVAQQFIARGLGERINGTVLGGFDLPKLYLSNSEEEGPVVEINPVAVTAIALTTKTLTHKQTREQHVVYTVSLMIRDNIKIEIGPYANKEEALRNLKRYGLAAKAAVLSGEFFLKFMKENTDIPDLTLVPDPVLESEGGAVGDEAPPPDSDTP